MQFSFFAHTFQPPVLFLILFNLIFFLCAQFFCIFVFKSIFICLSLPFGHVFLIVNDYVAVRSVHVWQCLVKKRLMRGKKSLLRLNPSENERIYQPLQRIMNYENNSRRRENNYPSAFFFLFCQTCFPYFFLITYRK